MGLQSVFNPAHIISFMSAAREDVKFKKIFIVIAGFQNIYWQEYDQTLVAISEGGLDKEP